MRSMYICDLAYHPGVTPLVNRHTDCPQDQQHAPEPTGYIAWFEWAKLMSKTHRQRQCPGCGRWAIWKPKVAHGERVEP